MNTLPALLKALLFGYVLKTVFTFVYAQPSHAASSEKEQTQAVTEQLSKAQLSTPSATSLADYRWQQRLLITHSEQHMPQLQRLMQREDHSLKELKLTVLVSSANNSNQVLVLNTMLWVDAPILAKELKKLLNSEPTALLLVGLDGGVKQRYDINDFQFINVIGDINSMPMRRAELRNQ